MHPLTNARYSSGKAEAEAVLCAYCKSNIAYPQCPFADKAPDKRFARPFTEKD